MMGSIRDMIAAAKRITPHEQHSVAEIAVIGAGNTLYSVNKMARINDKLLIRQLDGLARMGAPYDNYASGDIAKAGAEQYKPRLTFKLRWCKELEAMRYNTQQHRIVYQGHTFNIKDYDDFMEQHIFVNLVGEAYG
jgi:hypothetical protein